MSALVQDVADRSPRQPHRRSPPPLLRRPHHREARRREVVIEGVMKDAEANADGLRIMEPPHEGDTTSLWPLRRNRARHRRLLGSSNGVGGYLERGTTTNDDQLGRLADRIGGVGGGPSHACRYSPCTEGQGAIAEKGI